MTWNNLLGLGESGDAGIINMEDDDEEESDSEAAEARPDGPSGGHPHHSTTSIMGGLLQNFTGLTGSQQPGGGHEMEDATSGAKPFENLRDLMCHHAHLAVLLNYVISNSDPAPLVRI